LQDDEILEVWSAREKVIRLDFGDGVFFRQENEIAGLGSGIARKINDGLWGDFE